MDKKIDQTNEPLLKERGYVKCLSAGMRLPLRHPWGFLRHIWPSLLFSMLAAYAASRVMAPNIMAVFSAFAAEDFIPSQLFNTPLLVVVGIGYLNVLCYALVTGHATYLMRRYAELTYLPAVQPWHVWKDIMPCIVRSIVSLSIGYFILIGICAASLLLPSLGWSLIAMTLTGILFTLLYIPICQHYLMDGSLSYVAALRWPSKHVGTTSKTYAIVLVSGLLVIAVTLIGYIPSLCTIYVGGMSDEAVAIGDPTDLPSSFNFVRGISFALGALISKLSIIFLLIPLAFDWGSKKVEQ